MTDVDSDSRTDEAQSKATSNLAGHDQEQTNSESGLALQETADKESSSSLRNESAPGPVDMIAFILHNT